MTHTIHRTFLGRWFGKVSKVVISESSLSLVDLNNKSKEISIEQLIDFPMIENSLFGQTLVIKAQVNPSIENKMKYEVTKIWGISATSVKHFENRLTKDLNIKLCEIFSAKFDCFYKEAIFQFLRDSSIDRLNETVTPLVQMYRKSKKRWQKILSKEQLSKLDVISRMPVINDADSFRKYYENKVLGAQSVFFDGIESNPLTKDQRLAVIRNNDKNLILAAAGTGKTSVMVAKALHLISHDKVPAEKVLVLAYNNAAAKELKERLAARQSAFGLSCRSPSIMTFHALGLKILNEVKATTALSAFAEEPKQLESWLSKWLVIHISQSNASMRRFIELAYQADDALKSNSQQEHEDHVRNLLSKSTEEIVAAITASGVLAKNIKKYIKCLQAIRVEQLTLGQIESRLHNGEVNSSNQLAALLNEIAQAYAAELNKQGTIDFDGMIINAFEHVSVGDYLPQWTDILVDEFQDISSARMKLLNELLSKGPKPRLTAVGDDWQSIYRFSGAKLALITQFEKLSGSHSLTTLQKTFRYNNSIADTAGRFVMQNPEQYTKYIESYHRVDESQVYLVDCSENNINKRIKQIVGNIKSNDTAGSIAILARYHHLLNDAKEQLSSLSAASNINYWTFHGSKGLEADYSIIIGLFSGNTGFPSQNKKEIIVEALLPSTDDFKHSEERRLLYVAMTRAKKKVYLVSDPMAPSEFISELVSPDYDVNIMSDKFDKTNKPAKLCGKCSRVMQLRKGPYGDFWGCSGFANKSDQCNYTEKVVVTTLAR